MAAQDRDQMIQILLKIMYPQHPLIPHLTLHIRHPKLQNLLHIRTLLSQIRI